MKFNLKTFAFLLIALCAFSFSASAVPRSAPGDDKTQIQSQPDQPAITLSASADSASAQLQPTAPDQLYLISEDRQLKEFAEIYPFDFDRVRLRPVDNIPLTLPFCLLTTAREQPARNEPDVIRKPQRYANRN